MEQMTLEEDIAKHFVYLASRNLFARLGVEAFEDAVARGFEPISVIISKRPACEELAERIRRDFPNTRVHIAEERRVDELIADHFSHTVAEGRESVELRASFPMCELPDADEVLENCRRVVVLDDVNTPVNHVSLARMAKRLGIDAILMAGESRFTYFSRLFRETKGAIHDLTVARLRDWPGGIDSTLRKHGFSTMALALRDDAIDARDLRLGKDERIAVLLGNENRGLDASVIEQCDYTVKIPMSRGVDSLNVSTACAIMFYELAKGE